MTFWYRRVVTPEGMEEATEQKVPKPTNIKALDNILLSYNPETLRSGKYVTVFCWVKLVVCVYLWRILVMTECSKFHAPSSMITGNETMSGLTRDLLLVSGSSFYHSCACILRYVPLQLSMRTHATRI